METKFDIKKTCAFTGHRKLGTDFSEEILEKEILAATDGGFDTFLVGMAIGFDSACFRTLEKIREYKNIRIIACIPCPEQAKNFSYSAKLEYERMLQSADEKINVSDHYFIGCMQKRNRFMVDNSSLVIAYLRTSSGGTFGTVKYADGQGKKIIYV